MTVSHSCNGPQLMLHEQLRLKDKRTSGHTQDFQDIRKALILCGQNAKKANCSGHNLIHLITWLLYNFDPNCFVIGGKLNELIRTLEADKATKGFEWFYKEWGSLTFEEWQRLNPIEILTAIGKNMENSSAIEIDDMINMLGGNQVTYNKARDYDFIEKVLQFYSLGCPKVP
jgi:hypothetical protein